MSHRPLFFFGTTNLDFCFNVERLPTPGETVAGTPARHAGGKGANQAVAAARLGMRPKFFTRLGDDAAGHMLLDALASAGVNTEAVLVAPGEMSGSAAVIVDDDGGNMIVIAPGANAEITGPMIRDAGELIEENSIVIAEMGLPVSALEELFALRDKKGFQLVFNPAPVRPGLSSFAWKQVDFITPNETEAFELTGIELTDLAPPARLRMRSWGWGLAPR
ncbi:PfkB family carbohydrate kinase [Phyllobacterium zundukense]|uniref:PfkB family carbohydrate kinase n=1 Tax=Phyllobacterium zundukense TaxID=1867719 RepID=A0ACD4CWA8_9HYPH|nr:PfkB family carbohydrate kinase [Phyllobacterium zundukense]UXN57753.1 PfkB family carbohydrate kinase [Phyllobacterium zundukense]